MLSTLIVSGSEAWVARCFKADLQGSKTRGNVGLGEGKKGGLSGEINGFNVLGDLIECLTYTRVGVSHFEKMPGFLRSSATWIGDRTVVRGEKLVVSSTVG